MKNESSDLLVTSISEFRKGKEISPLLEEIYPLRDADWLFATNEIIQSGVRGVGHQFGQDAEVYDERYYNPEGQEQALKIALAAFDLSPSDIYGTVLDLGCGSGNSTMALLRVIPNADVYATDLSPEMLRILRNRAIRQGFDQRLTLFSANSERIKLKESACNLIVGSSMIHHMMEPEKFLKAALRSLRPGAVAYFIEPFQAGHVAIRLVFSSLVRLAQHETGLAPEFLEFMTAYCGTIDMMLQTEGRDPALYATLEDKWMFPRTTFERAASEASCDLQIVPFGGLRGPVEDLLYKGTGLRTPLPDWVIEFLNENEACLNADVKSELLSSGIVIFHRRLNAEQSNEMAVPTSRPVGQASKPVAGVFQYQSFEDAPGMVNSRAKLRAFCFPTLIEKSFLDIACNEGYYCGVALEAGARRVVGLDSGLGWIERARSRFPAAEFLHQTWDALPDEKFDVILFASALHYISNSTQIVEHIREMSSRLTPNGVLILEVGIIDGEGSALITHKRADGSQVYYPTFCRFESILDEAGLSYRQIGPSEPGDSIPRWVFHCRIRKPSVLFVCGASGVGKTNITRALTTFDRLYHVSVDYLRQKLLNERYPGEYESYSENGFLRIYHREPEVGVEFLAQSLATAVRDLAETTKGRSAVVVDGLDLEHEAFARVHEKTVGLLEGEFAVWTATQDSSPLRKAH